MKLVLILNGFIVGSFSQSFQRPNITHIYALGDSITDTGNFYKLSNQTFPTPKYYYKGRFSNGPTWVEYLAKKLPAQLASFAYGKATSDNKMFPADDHYDIPDCQQQAQNFIKEVKATPLAKRSHPNQSLMTLGFFGNDFFNFKATPELHVENIKKCIHLIASTGFVKHIVIPTSAAPELYPYFKTTSDFVKSYAVSNAATVQLIWQNQFKNVTQRYPEVYFYNLDFNGLLHSIADSIGPYPYLITDVACMPYTPGDNFPKNYKPCKNPNDYMFYDGLHPTTRMHYFLSLQTLRIMKLAPQPREKPRQKPKEESQDKLLIKSQKKSKRKSQDEPQGINQNKFYTRP